MDNKKFCIRNIFYKLDPIDICDMTEEEMRAVLNNICTFELKSCKCNEDVAFITDEDLANIIRGWTK